MTRPLVGLGRGDTGNFARTPGLSRAVSTADEIGDLVRSFNRMAEELEASRRQIEASSRDLSAANAELDQRRRQMETILESIPTGVLSLDAERRVTHGNQALLRMFHPDAGHDGSPQILLRRASGGSIPRGSAGGFRAAAAARRPHGHDHQPDGDAVADGSR